MFWYFCHEYASGKPAKSQSAHILPDSNAQVKTNQPQTVIPERGPDSPTSWVAAKPQPFRDKPSSQWRPLTLTTDH